MHCSRNGPIPEPSNEPGRGPANAIDRYVGFRVRERRMALGLSQHQFALLIGCTYQQVHKYEHGMNRVAAGRLYAMANSLNAPIAWFFEGLSMSDPDQDRTPCRRMLLEFMRDVSTISELWQLDALSKLAGALAASEQD